MNITKLLAIFLLLLMQFTSIAQTPKRIVSLVPSISKQLYELNVEDKLVGCTNYCPGKDRNSVTVVASAITVNIEKTLLLKPDLIIASSLTSPKTLATFKKFEIKTIWFDYPKSYEDLCTQFLELGKITGKQKEAERIIAKSKSKLLAIGKKVPKNKKYNIFIEVGANPLWAAIENSFMHDYITFAGGRNIASGLKSGSISRESVLIKNPDAIFIITMGVIGKQETEVWQSYKSLNAAKNNLIFVINADLASSPTPATFVTVVEQMVGFMYNVKM